MRPEPTIAPPRPNLGPDALPDPPGWPWLVVALALAAALAFMVVRLRRRHKARARAGPAPVEAAGPVEAPTDGPPALPDRVREALVRAFGPSWRARTTEEVAASSALVDRFGDEVAGRVVAYLRAADRAKFSADGAGPPEDLEGWASLFVGEVGTGAGGAVADAAKSRINGR